MSSPGRPLGGAGQSQQRLNIKIPQIARWSIAGIGNTKIADLLGMTAQGVAAIKASTEYIEYETALLNGHLSAMDRALAGKVLAIHKEIQAAVPAALRCLVDAATQRKDLKAAISASIELLDRDPDRTLSKTKKEGEDRPGDLPEAVLNDVIDSGNKIAANYAEKAKESVN